MINHYEGDNIGGIYQIEIIEHYNIQSLNPLVTVAGILWQGIHFKEESGQMKLKTSETDNGTVFNYSGSFFIHNIRPEVNELNKYLGQVAALRITDMNGLISVIGAPGLPVTLLKSSDTGKRYIHENGTEFTFEIDQTQPAEIILD